MYKYSLTCHLYKCLSSWILPSSRVSTGLHLSIPRVELKLSTKFEVLESLHTFGSNLCLLQVDGSPNSANQAITLSPPASLSLSIAFLNVNCEVALQALQKRMYIKGPENCFL